MEPDAAEVEQLVRRAQRRDAAAFAQLVRAYERTALAVAYSVLGKGPDAGDVVQQVFLRAWERVGELKDPARFGAWLCGIVRNLAIDARRRRTRHDGWAHATGPAMAAAAEDERAAADPSRVLVRREDQQRLEHALESLDEVSRSAVMLRYYEDLSSKEIGELLGLAPAAVDMRLMRARRQLRQRLEMPPERPAGAAKRA